MFKKIISAIVAVIMMVSVGTTVFASESYEDVDGVHVNDIVITDEDTGEKGIVIAVREDGSFTTASLVALRANPATCSHPAIVGYGTKWTQTESLNATNSSWCYTERSVQNAMCTLCGRSDFKFFGELTYKPHSFPWFSKTCGTCGYVK